MSWGWGSFPLFQEDFSQHQKQPQLRDFCENSLRGTLSKKHGLRHTFQRTPRGGQNSGGGREQNLTRTPPQKTVSDPPHIRPPPHPISLINSLTNPQNFTQVTSETNFWRVSKNGVQWAILATFCFSVHSPPPPFPPFRSLAFGHLLGYHKFGASQKGFFGKGSEKSSRP